jgi:hypothetical protein
MTLFVELRLAFSCSLASGAILCNNLLMAGIYNTLLWSSTPVGLQCHELRCFCHSFNVVEQVGQGAHATAVQTPGVDYYTEFDIVEVNAKKVYPSTPCLQHSSLNGHIFLLVVQKYHIFSMVM